MMKGHPASMAALKGTYSQECRSSAVRSDVTAPVCESPWVSPWPGKCLAQGKVPAWSIAVTSAETIWAQTSGSLEKDRWPITGFSGLVRTSASGAKSTLKPMSRR